MVLVGQSVGHHANQLLPSGLAGRGEILGEVCGQHNDENVSQELGGQERKSGQHGTEHPFIPCRTQVLEGKPICYAGCWRLPRREALLAEFSVQESVLCQPQAPVSTSSAPAFSHTCFFQTLECISKHSIYFFSFLL